MSKKNIFLICSIIFLLLSILIIIIMHNNKPIFQKNNHTASTSTVKHNKKSLTQKKSSPIPQIPQTPQAAQTTSSKEQKTTQNSLQTNDVSIKNSHIKNRFPTLLPSYYSKSLSRGTLKETKEQAVENLPYYYGIQSLTEPIITKEEALQNLSPHYGKIPYKSLDHSDAKESTSSLTHNPNLSFFVDTDTFFNGVSNQSLLNDNLDYDKSIFIQTIINLPLYLKVPAQEWGKVEFNFTGRINTIWGSSELATTTSEFIKIGRGITETKHYHEFSQPIFWVRETWLKMYSQSEKTIAQIGFFPRQIGLGLILGNLYKSGNPLLTNTEIKYIDQFRPGFEISTTFGKRNYKLSLYYSMYKNNATSFDKQAEFIHAQKLCDCGEGPPFQRANPSRPLFQTSHLAVAEFDIPVEIKKSVEHHMHIKPFLLYNRDRNQIVEFFGDAESSLVSLGSTFTYKNNQLEANFDYAGNLGFQDIKGWDRNVTEQHARTTQTHLFAKNFDNCNDDIINNLVNNINGDSAKSCSSCNGDIKNMLYNLDESSGEYILSPTFPYSQERDISLDYAAGEQFQQNDPSLIIQSPLNSNETINCNPIFKNSFSRFRKCYRNCYRSFMAAADIGYHYCNSYKLGIIIGYASGDDNPNDYAEKAYLYRLRSDWNDVRKDYNKTYNGFIGIQSLYTGKHVRTLQLLRAHRLSRPLSQVPELTPNQFTNLSYGGLGFWYDKDYYSGKLRLNANAVAMALPHEIMFGFDPVIQDVFETFDFKSDPETFKRFENYDKRLRQYLGLEINAFLEFFAKSNITIYGILSIFLPGSYYKDIQRLTDCCGQNIPLKNQYVSIAKDKTGFESRERTSITLKNNTAIVAHAGIKFNFDTASCYNPIRSKSKKKIR